MKGKIAIVFAVVVVGTLISAFALYQMTFGPIAPPPTELATLVPYVKGEKAHAGPIPAIAGAHGLDVKVARALHDGETLTFGTKTFTVHAVPGHTPGSAVYVESGGVAFFGDAALFSKENTVLGPPFIFSDDVALGVASLKALAPTLREVKTFAFAHSAVMSPAHVDALASVKE